MNKKILLVKSSTEKDAHLIILNQLLWRTTPTWTQWPLETLLPLGRWSRAAALNARPTMVREVHPREYIIIIGAVSWPPTRPAVRCWSWTPRVIATGHGASYNDCGGRWCRHRGAPTLWWSTTSEPSTTSVMTSSPVTGTDRYEEILQRVNLSRVYRSFKILSG